jgi:hypothetical protein
MDTRQQRIHDYEAAAASLPALDCEGECYEEASHVFKCMQCDVEFQMDTAFTKHEGEDSIDEIVRMRIDPASASPSVYRAVGLSNGLADRVP